MGLFTDNAENSYDYKVQQNCYSVFRIVIYFYLGQKQKRLPHKLNVSSVSDWLIMSFNILHCILFPSTEVCFCTFRFESFILFLKWQQTMPVHYGCQ